MDRDDEKREEEKTNIRALFGDATPKKTRAKKEPQEAGQVPPMIVAGNNVTDSNIVTGNNNVVSGRATIYNTSRVPRPKMEIARVGGEIDERQAKVIYDHIHKWADILIQGGQPQHPTFSYCWNTFKRDFNLTVYKALPKAKYNAALKWFYQQEAIATSKTSCIARPPEQRGTRAAPADMPSKEQLIKLIETLIKEAGSSKADFFLMISRKLGKTFVSMNRMKYSDLDWAYRELMGEKTDE